jgi:hypothetical protein
MMANKINLCAAIVMAGAIQGMAQENKNSIGVNFRLGFNVSADFKDITEPTAPGEAAGGGLDRLYQNGFVGVDSSGNAGGLTWYWGYESEEQLRIPGYLLMDGATTETPGETSETSEMLPGIELVYERGLAQWDWGSFGLLAAVGYMDIQIDGNSSYVTDAYDLGSPAIDVDPAPYSGSYDGPGPLISDSPIRGTTSVVHEYKANLYSLRGGAFLGFPLGDHFRLNAGCGLVVAYLDGEYSYEETTSIPSLDSTMGTGNLSDNETYWGAYAEGGLDWIVSESWQVSIAAQFLALDEYTGAVDGKKIAIDLGQTISLDFGVAYLF